MSDGGVPRMAGKLPREGQILRFVGVMAAVLVTAATSWAGLDQDYNETLRELRLGYAALDQRSFEDAFEHYSRAAKLARGDEQRFNAFFGLGSAALELGRIVEARSAFERAYEVRPGETETSFMLGLTCRRQGEYEQALRYFAETVAKDEDFVQALVEMGVTYALMERHTDAERVCRQVLDREPDNIQARMGLAVALFHSDAFDPAVEQFQEVLTRDPGNIRAHYGLGLAQLFAGDRSKAMEELTYLREHDPDLADELYSWLYPNR